MIPQNERPHPDPLETLLAVTARDAPAPDAAFLDRLGEHSTKAFAAAPDTATPPRRRRMTTFLTRVAAAAAILLLALCSYWYWQEHVAPPTFGRIVAQLNAAHSLHFQVVQGEQTSQVWVQQPHRWRWEETAENYRVGNRGHAWSVDERLNKAVPEHSPWFDSTRQRLDVGAMLGLPTHEHHFEQRPAERVQRDGRDYWVYRLVFDAPAGGGLVGPTSIEAFVDVQTRLLHTLETTAGQGPGAIGLSALTVLAHNQQVPEDKLLVKETLSEDGRIGKVTDAQGIAGLKPVLHERWTPVTAGLVLKPGDWLRTDPRGANAVACRLLKQTYLTVGPGSVLELVSPTQLRLSDGEVECNVPEGTVELFGPDGQKLAVKGKVHYRVDRQKLVAVPVEPLWLKGFKGTTANESLGSLIANVDGRNVSLTVGYHKVTVDVRDQIARTTIEESFVNHTPGTLEGVFHFPLPQDASISGFGMWIGNELVMADVVEKQRAREIYEEILRERRDPGLLEWAGGNVFKARVFPIFGHSEKRIKISYTQVLPLRGNKYRYSYALQSELLQQHPLKELALDVRVNSALPLHQVTCPTHPARITKTENSARVEFTAQQYTPTRDFEVVVTVDHAKQDVVLVPHRRGDDGYFLLQLTPPSPAGDWDRPVLAGSKPLHLLILADTSASMDARQRAQQAELVAALLGSLTPRDTVNLACCDVECDWLFERPVAADAKQVAAIQQFLAQRISLGWTDLDKAFASALAQVGPQTQVIYLGDGTVTTRDADPAAFAGRLRRLADGKPGTFHAVAVGSTYEPAALKAIGGVGGGSFRRVTAERGPQATALELLYEITQPVLRDLKVEFKGLRTARVYPQELPNLAPGTQHLVLGRYLPEGRDQEGEVVVTGTQHGQPLTFRRRVTLRDAESGNSFIPRLWARQHLDHLLDQGSSGSVREDIIALSEEYQILTPYTSFLVLETDADRERFAVKRSFRMRDGEKFFQQGLDTMRFDLAQQQMKKAGGWRVGLRRQVLQQFATLGRNPRLLQQDGNALLHRLSDFDESYEFRGRALRDQMGFGSYSSNGSSVFLGGLGKGSPSDPGLYLSREDLGQKTDGELDLPGEAQAAAAAPPGTPAPGAERLSAGDIAEVYPPGGSFLGLPPLTTAPGGDLGGMGFRGELPAGQPEPYYFLRDRLYDERTLDLGAAYGQSGGRFRGRGYPANHAQVLLGLFPVLPGSPGTPTHKPSEGWPEAARALSRGLLRTEKLAKLAGGIEVIQHHESFDPRWGELQAQSYARALYSPRRWLLLNRGDGSGTLVDWCDAKERGIWSRVFQLGRVRESAAADLNVVPFTLSDYSLVSLEHTFQGYTATVERPAKDRALLLLRYRNDVTAEHRILIDTARQVVLSVEYWYQGKVSSATRLDDFVEVLGTWWARKVETTNHKGERANVVRLEVRALTADALAEQVQAEMAGRERVLLLRQPLPKLAEAKKAVSTGKAGFEDQFLLLLHFAQSQQWTRVREQLEQCEKLAANRPGLRWLRDSVLYVSRRHDELRKRVTEEADRFTQAPAGAVPSDDLVLAQHLVSQANNVLEVNERLAVVEALRPVFERQPQHTHARKAWRQYRVNALLSAGRPEESRKEYQQLAADYPRDYQLQQGYAQTLFQAGEQEAAHAWLRRVLVKEARWTPDEERYLRTTLVNFFEQQGRYDELAKYLEARFQDNNEGQSAHSQYLSALVRSDQAEKADKLVAQWLQDGMANEVPAQTAERLHAAVAYALGAGHNLRHDRIEERWLKPLGALVERYARHRTLAGVTETIMQNGHFHRYDECRRLRKLFAEVLVAESARLTPAEVRRFLAWIWPNDPAVEAAAWRTLAGSLRERWLAEKDVYHKHALGESLQQIYNGRLPAAELLGFLRQQVSDGPAAYRTQYRGTLFNTLLQQPWTAEHEDEAFRLLAQLSEAEERGERLRVALEGLHRFTDGMVQARYDAQQKRLENPEKLSRTDLLAKQDEFRKQARVALAERLLKEEGIQRLANPRNPQLPPEAWADWLAMERTYLNLQLERDLADVAAFCWRILGDAPKPAAAEGEISTETHLAALLKGRCLTTLCHLATRRDAKPELADRLLQFATKAQAAGDEDGRWQTLRYRLLIALDRPRELEQVLQEWIRANDPDNQWRLTLGYVLAEQGRIQEAIRLFEGVEFSDSLGPTAFRTLAGWYLVVNRRADHDRATKQYYATLDEFTLSRLLGVKLNPWQRGDANLPGELDQEVLLIFQVLFEKSTHPASYLHQVHQFYDACRDFRLLAMLADGVVGHSAGKVYPFLSGMQSVLGSIHEEATADTLFARIDDLREKARTDVDRRALDLLEVMVRRRAAEIKNQPGPHVAAALAALQRAFNRHWTPGEPRLMADLLADLGAISQAPLAQEQLRQLEALHSMPARGSADRMHIAFRHAGTLWAYGRRNPAADLLGAALQEFQEAHEGKLSSSAQEAFNTYIGYLETLRHFVRGEKALLAQLRRPLHQQQTLWLTLRLYQLYDVCLGAEGEVSLGASQTLYATLHKRIQADLGTTDHNHRNALVLRLCDVYRTAHRRKLDGVIADLRAFAFQQMSGVLEAQTNHYTNLVSTVASTLHDVAGPRDGLAFLIVRIEKEPAWFRLASLDGWQQHGSTLAYWRTQVKELGDLEPRLLKIVLTALRRDLESQRAHNRVMYWTGHSYYWSEKVDDFGRVAEEVLRKNDNSGAAVQYLAEYFYHGLGRHGRAIDILFAAHQRKLLDEGGQARLVQYLHDQSRHAESIPLLRPLVELRPDHVHYRVQLLHAYFCTKRHGDLAAFLKETDAHFRKPGKWTEPVIAALAHSCLANRLYEPCIGYFNEVIPLHQRTHANRGIGNGTLSSYYASLSAAYAALQKTPEAVDAASGAIVSWGPNMQNRNQAHQALLHVLRTAPDLDGYVAHLDAETARSGKDSPILRKAVGQIYLEKAAYAKAGTQLRLALELQPNDRETHDALLASYDRQNDREGAVRQVLQAVQLSRRDLALYRDLGRRYTELKQPKEAERAYTSLVEMQALETESHTMLAEVRQQQNRWPEAIEHWRRVAGLRALEPTGLLRLAEAYVHEKQWVQAAETVAKLRATTWPRRFDEDRKRIRELEQRIEAAQKP